MNLFHLKIALISLLLLWQTTSQPSSPLARFRYTRLIVLPARPVSGQTCAILDADIFAHAAPALKDLRLYRGKTELRYSTTVSEPSQQDTEDVRVLNLQAHSGHVAFDLEMPRHPYTSVVLDLAARDYVATATVSGSRTADGRNPTALGTFTVFDLSSQHLSRSTTLPLFELVYPFLHIELSFISASGRKASAASLNVAASVRSATVPPSREAQSLYSPTQQPHALVQTERGAVAAFEVPARVPIERIAFTLPPDYKGNFSRAVRIKARGIAASDAVNNAEPSDEEATGTILRVNKTEAGQDLAAETLTIPVAIGSNMQQSAIIEVHVGNNADAPLPLFVVPQMRERRICFDATADHAPIALYYGDPTLDYSDPTLDAPGPLIGKISIASGIPHVAELSPETLNPNFSATPRRERPGKHRPVLRWVALLGCVCIFALLVIRSRHKRK